MSDISYSKATFKATHNSYSGPLPNFDRGSIPQQLDAGVRFIEFDVNCVDYLQVRDYQVGHEKPGLEVHHADGNPSTLVMEDWLGVIATWSDAHPDHVPITVGLDLKNNLAKIETMLEGNLAALNRHVRNALGDKLFTPIELGDGDWPSVNELRGRIIVVMSGDTKSRVAYLKDHGEDPAVDMNSHGHILEVHKSQANAGMWFWTGRYRDDDTVVWEGHGDLEKGLAPAVCINDDNLVVVVSQSHRRNMLYYQVGRLNDDGHLEISKEYKLHGGTDASVRFVEPNSLDISLIYRAGGQNYECIGTFDPDTPTVRWGAPGQTDKALHDKTTAQLGGRQVSVTSDQTLLRYETGGHQGQIGYEQLLFVEYQRGNDDVLADTWFYACSKNYLSWGQEKCAAGKLVRIWGFGKDHATLPKVSFPATDWPFEDWYARYCESIHTIE